MNSKFETSIAGYRISILFVNDFHLSHKRMHWTVGMPRQVNLENLWQKANSYLQADNQRKALPLLRKIYKAMPDDAAVVYNLGACLYELGKVDEALKFIDRACAIDPDEKLFLSLLARIYYSLGEIVKSIEIYEHLSSSGFNSLGFFRRYADALFAAEDFHQAIILYKQSLIEEPNNIYLLNRVGDSLVSNGNFSEAIKYFNKSLDIEKDNPQTLFGLGRSYQACGELHVALNCYKKSMELDPAFKGAEKAYKFLVLNIPDMTTEDLFEAHIKIGRGYQNNLLDQNFNRPFKSGSQEKLKIGFVSSDFRIHVVAFNLLPLIENLDRENYSIHLFSDVSMPDTLTKKFENLCDKWYNIKDLSDHEAAKKIKSSGIDILLFLAGRFDGNRPEIASYRPAPIQVSFHDCATTGLPEMDYWLTDNLLNPENTTELSTEKLYRLPCFYQFDISQILPKLDAPPSQSCNLVTFGSLNKPEKLNGSVLELWARILRDVPKSQLLLKYFDHYKDPRIQSRIMKILEKSNISPKRVLFQSGIKTNLKHLEILNQIDIALDPFPFNGATTTIEALKMGVPVIALWGKHFVDRVGATLVTQAGFQELAANSPDEYVKIAVKLANNRNKILLYRETIRPSVLSSPLFDGKSYAKNMEAAFRAICTPSDT